MQRRSTQVRDRGAQTAENIVERQQRPPPKLDHEPEPESAGARQANATADGPKGGIYVLPAQRRRCVEQLTIAHPTYAEGLGSGLNQHQNATTAARATAEA